jgi:hypothetical protein
MMHIFTFKVSSGQIMKKTNREKQLNIAFNLLIAAGILANFISPEDTGHQSIAKAYLDPSTGSMIISAIVGVLATIVLGVKTFWYKITAIFRPAKKQASPKDMSASNKNL